MAGISMTPFDVLYAVLAGSGAQWSPEQVDEVLGQNNYDVEATMAYIMDNGGLPSAPVAPKAATDPNAATPPPPNAPSGAPVPVSTGPASAGSPRFPHRTAGSGGVSVVAREAFTNHRGGSPHSPSRFGIISRSATPPGRAIGGGRVCRYFLAGECRRADCRFSHDLGRALCRFWLRGQVSERVEPA